MVNLENHELRYLIEDMRQESRRDFFIDDESDLENLLEWSREAKRLLVDAADAIQALVGDLAIAKLK